jgi:gliding motility-associated-like protein
VKSRYGFLLYFFFLIINFSANATHIRAGEIRVKQLDCTNGKFSITLIMYGNTLTPINPGGGVLNFGDGSSITLPSGSFIPRSDLGTSVGIYTFNIEHTYNTVGAYKISYSETNRNGGILNIQNSSDTPFFIDTSITFDKLICNNSPELLSPPIDRACSSLIFFHNPGAYDEDGDSLSFEIAIPLASTTQTATYLPPNHQSFYSNNFNSGNESGTGQPQFSINSQTGTIIWDAPGAVGEYNIAIIVNEWRRTNDVLVKIGSVRRDMQIVVEECNNRRPTLLIPQDICIYAGTTIDKNILGTDPDNDDVKIEVFSGIFSLSNNPATFIPNPPVFQSSSPQAKLSFNWTPSCSEVRNQPYQVTVKISDNPSTGPKLVQFKTWNIKVAAPPPTLSNSELDIIAKKAKITWTPYMCSNATKIVVWRKVGSYLYNPDDCVSGLPKFAGYTKIAEVSSSNAEYIDDNNGKGLAVGAVYCYRLTALFPLVGGAESKVSTEICLPPILADAPVITHVTVNKTDSQKGEMIVSWQGPYDLSQIEYLKPYEYAIFRAKGLEGENELTKIHAGNILETTFTDQNLNTLDFPYNYRIVLLAKSVNNSTLITIDTSSVASSVWNSATPRENSIEVNWIAETPWSNVFQNNPWHLIYRSSEDSGVNNFVLIDSINVSEDGFYYLDKGTFQGKKLVNSEFYCYRIKTRGTYGNPLIESPIENFSQVICSTIYDNIPPCKPELIITKVDCNLFSIQTPCSQKLYSNSLNWLPPAENECMQDTYSYQVLAANSPHEEFQLIGTTQGTTFVENGLLKLSRCYKIAAVDRSGNVSDFSETLCFDNCPAVYLPNVFTPNGDNYNENFALYRTDHECSRFINQVSFTVFNRWGQKIINRQNDGVFLWDGKDQHGDKVPGGVYYYSADVIFDVIDSEIRNKNIKGWIQIID